MSRLHSKLTIMQQYLTMSIVLNVFQLCIIVGYVTFTLTECLP